MDIEEYKAWLKDHQLRLAPIDISNLIGENALTIIIAVKKALFRQGWDETQLNTFVTSALSGDYEQLVTVCVETCDEGSYKNQD